ncbi:MAG: sugar phosphate isomerase/epimerase family protein [Methanocella sp.]
MSRVSFSAYRMVNYPFSWALGLEDMGFEGWEIVSEGRQKITPESLPEIRDIIGTMGLKITVHGPFSDLNPASLIEPIWEETIRQINHCVRLSSDFSDVVVVHPGILSPLGSQMPDKTWERNVEALRVICRHAQDYGVRICLENMPNMEKLLCRTPDELFGMVDSVGMDNLGTTFDAGHANTSKNTAGYLKEKARISHVHIHDNKGVKDEHLALGDGNVNWDNVLGGLKGFEGMLVIEGRNVEEGKRSLEFLRRWNAKNR